MIRDRERFSPAQCRAARGLLDWPADRLAEAAGLEPEAIELYEHGEGDLSQGELGRLGAALRRGGVMAIPEVDAGEGVRLRARRARPFRSASAQSFAEEFK